MHFKQKIAYFFIALIMFIILALLEFFVLDGFAYIIVKTWLGRTIIFTIMLLLFNPYIVYKLMELVPFKVKGLKVAGGLKEALRKETNI